MIRNTASDGDQLCRILLNKILAEGQQAAPRGKKVLELVTPTVVTLTDPRRPLVTSSVRKANYRFGMAEACWIASGSEDLSLVAKHNSRMNDFSDDGEVLWGAYGPRVIGQLSHVIEVLRDDHDSRQAVLTTWRPMVDGVNVKDHESADNAKKGGLVIGNFLSRFFPSWNGSSWKSKDVPCTVAWHFMIRSNRLNLTVFMRSNDAWLGTPYDILSFTTIQRCVASILEVEVGVYNHVVSNLHLYEENLEQAAVLAASVPARTYESLSDFGFKSIEEMTAKMSLALAGTKTGDPGADEYASVINKSRRAVT